MVTVVGGKLTTYRAMAEEAVDRAIAVSGLRARPCRTRALPLGGAAPQEELDAVQAPRGLIDRYGTEAPGEIAEAHGERNLPHPLLRGITSAEMRFGPRRE